MARESHRNTDTGGAADELAADREGLPDEQPDPFGQQRGLLQRHRLMRHDHELVPALTSEKCSVSDGFAQPPGELCDQFVPRGVAEQVVDRFQPVQVGEQHRHRSVLSRREAVIEMIGEHPAVAQPGEIVVFCQKLQPFDRDQPGLQLGEHGRDGLQGVELFFQPLPVAVFHETQRAGGDVVRQQRHAGQRRLRNLGALLDRLLILVGLGLRADHQRLLEPFGHREDRVGVGEVDDTDRVRVGHEGAYRPLCHQPGRVDLVIVVP